MRNSLFWSGGGTGLRHDAELHQCISSFRPHIIILQIGGNDICDPWARPETITCNITELIRTLHSFHSVRVGVVCELFIRTAPRRVSAHAYEEKPVIIRCSRFFFRIYTQ
jgi:lysophospholipase L1-like esterase